MSESRNTGPAQSAPREISKNWLKGKKVVQSGRNPKIHNHIPGYPVGSIFKDRHECSAAGVHAPLRAGIHGNSTDGAYSVVLSGGYEDDEDKGETFVYSGQGGRDTSGDLMDKMQGKTKWEGPQNADQEWVRGNKALKISATTKKPVRVVRSALRKKNQYSRYAPSEGLRYDGLYVVDRAWREVGSTGYRICKFAFRRLPNQPPLPGERLRIGVRRTRSVSPEAGPSRVVPKAYVEKTIPDGEPRPVPRSNPLYKPLRLSTPPMAGPSRSRATPELPAIHLQKSGNSLKPSSIPPRPIAGPSKVQYVPSSNPRGPTAATVKSNNHVAGSSRPVYPTRATPQPLPLPMVRPDDQFFSSRPSSANSIHGVKRQRDETDDNDIDDGRGRQSVMSEMSAGSRSEPAPTPGRWDTVRGVSKLSNLKFRKIKKPDDSAAT